MPAPLMTSSLALIGTCAPVLKLVLAGTRGACGDYVTQLTTVLGQSLCVEDDEVASEAAVCIEKIGVTCGEEMSEYPTWISAMCAAFEVCIFQL